LKSSSINDKIILYNPTRIANFKKTKTEESNEVINKSSKDTEKKPPQGGSKRVKDFGKDKK